MKRRTKLHQVWIWFGYIPVLSDWVLVAIHTFEIWSNPGVVTWNLAHEFVQELGGRHWGGGLPCRSFFRCCQAGRQKDNLVRDGRRELICNKKANFWQAGRWMWVWIGVIIHQLSTSKAIYHGQQWPGSDTNTQCMKGPGIKGHSSLATDISVQNSHICLLLEQLKKKHIFASTTTWKLHLKSWPSHITGNLSVLLQCKRQMVKIIRNPLLPSLSIQKHSHLAIKAA